MSPLLITNAVTMRFCSAPPLLTLALEVPLPTFEPVGHDAVVLSWLTLVMLQRLFFGHRSELITHCFGRIVLSEVLVAG